MCIYVCAIQKHLEDQNVKIELALVLVMYIHCDRWLKKTNIEIAILAIRGLKSLRKNPVYELQFMFAMS